MKKLIILLMLCAVNLLAAPTLIDKLYCYCRDTYPSTKPESLYEVQADDVRTWFVWQDATKPRPTDKQLNAYTDADKRAAKYKLVDRANYDWSNSVSVRVFADKAVMSQAEYVRRYTNTATQAVAP